MSKHESQNGIECAFPVLEVSGNFHGGLTKREHFAGLAMQGLLAANATYNGKTDDNVSLSRNAIQVADALLSELDK